MTVGFIDQHLETDFYWKPIDCHQFLDFNYVHPIHIKKTIEYSQGFCFKILCSSKKAFEFHLESIEGWFQNRRNPKALVENQLKGVTEIRQTSDQTYKRGNGLPVVLTYHLRLNNVNYIIKKHLVFLYSKEEVENIFTPPPFISFRTGFSLRKHFITAKV